MDQFTSNCVLLVVIAGILFLAVKYSIPHFKGEGSCCGGGSKMKLIKPAKLDTVIAEKNILIEGMVCEHCSGRIQNALNSVEGINAKVIRSKGKAVVKLGKQIGDEELKKIITDLGYKVTDIS
ncbi:MAG: heavy-metal-associated domain-containing protein [Lachnospiraceae bacterium]|nr:heavy-metal-associated domain-containing protein [Lachnospiraceae bacterium]